MTHLHDPITPEVITPAPLAEPLPHDWEAVEIRNGAGEVVCTVTVPCGTPPPQYIEFPEPVDTSTLAGTGVLRMPRRLALRNPHLDPRLKPSGLVSVPSYVDDDMVADLIKAMVSPVNPMVVRLCEPVTVTPRVRIELVDEHGRTWLERHRALGQRAVKSSSRARRSRRGARP